MSTEDKQQRKWITLDNATGTATLRQHCFVPAERKRKWTGETYLANVSRCGQSRVGNENEEIEAWDQMPPNEPISESACKTCKRLTQPK